MSAFNIRVVLLITLFFAFLSSCKPSSNIISKGINGPQLMLFHSDVLKAEAKPSQNRVAISAQPSQSDGEGKDIEEDACSEINVCFPICPNSNCNNSVYQKYNIKRLKPTGPCFCEFPNLKYIYNLGVNAGLELTQVEFIDSNNNALSNEPFQSIKIKGEAFSVAKLPKLQVGKSYNVNYQIKDKSGNRKSYTLKNIKVQGK